MKGVVPELRRLHSPDVKNLEEAAFGPEEPFCVLVQAMFGQKGEEGEESFDLVVCNSIWLKQKSLVGAFSGRHHLIVSEFNVQEIRSFWLKVASASAGSSWEEVALKLGRYGMWEFEDYQDLDL